MQHNSLQQKNHEKQYKKVVYLRLCITIYYEHVITALITNTNFTTTKDKERIFIK